MTAAEFNLLLAGIRSKAKLEIEKIYILGSYNPKTKKCTAQPTSVADRNAFHHKINASRAISNPKHNKIFMAIYNRLTRLVSADKTSTLTVQSNRHSRINISVNEAFNAIATAYEVTGWAVYAMTDRERAALEESNRRVLARIKHYNTSRPHETTTVNSIPISDEMSEKTKYVPKRLKRAPPTSRQIAARKKLKMLKLERAPGIYAIRHKPTDKFYVGQAQNVYNRVLLSHFGVGTHLGARCHNRYLSIDILADRIDAFEFGCVQFCEIDELNKCEMHWMRKLGTDYNLVEVDETARNFIPSLETSERLSDAAKKRAVRIAAEKKAGTRARFSSGSYSEALWNRLLEGSLTIKEIRNPKFCAPGHEDSNADWLADWVKKVVARSFGTVKIVGKGEKMKFIFKPGEHT
jgi:hypothetical protein